MAKYKIQIKHLECLIENWYDIKTPLDFHKIFLKHNINAHKFGLCNVCFLDCLPIDYLYNMFEDWEYFNGSTTYPVDGRDEFYLMQLITENPKRLHLAVHCLRWLREHNIVEEQ